MVIISVITINTGCCFISTIFNILTPIDESANDLFRLYHKAAPTVVTVFYAIATILHWQAIEESRYMLYVATFCFSCPLRAQKRAGDVYRW